MENILLALIISVIAPIIVGLITSYSNRADKREQWERDDVVAAKAAEAVKKLDVIHTLVNSNMTAAMQAEYEATKRELVLLLQVVELNKKAGNAPTTESLAEIEATRKKITELTIVLKDRTHTNV